MQSQQPPFVSVEEGPDRSAYAACKRFLKRHQRVFIALCGIWFIALPELIRERLDTMLQWDDTVFGSIALYLYRYGEVIELGFMLLRIVGIALLGLAVYFPAFLKVRARRKNLKQSLM